MLTFFLLASWGRKFDDIGVGICRFMCVHNLVSNRGLGSGLGVITINAVEISGSQRREQ